MIFRGNIREIIYAYTYTITLITFAVHTYECMINRNGEFSGRCVRVCCMSCLFSDGVMGVWVCRDWGWLLGLGRMSGYLSFARGGLGYSIEV
jgi:hypothetical protein